MKQRIALVCVHGLLKGNQPEIGAPDTGGQVAYVLELAKQLQLNDQVEEVFIFTRKFTDEGISSDYSVEIEPIGRKLNIYRIACGPDKFIPKEQIWEYLDIFAENVCIYIEQKELLPTIIHAHYADSGYSGIIIKKRLNIPLVYTPHSLGCLKREFTPKFQFKSGSQYQNIQYRINIENDVFMKSDIIIVSSELEKSAIVKHYSFSLGQKIAVNPPGQCWAHRCNENVHLEYLYNLLSGFIDNFNKPIILSIGRNDQNKNFETLIKSYGKSNDLQSQANLVILAGIRNEKIQNNLKMQIEQLAGDYDINGKIACIFQHDSTKISSFYMYCYQTRGVFVNVSYYETFGLTSIEAASYGLPLVLTQNGGAKEIVEEFGNGKIVDPLNEEEISSGIYEILSNQRVWKDCSQKSTSAVKKYSWEKYIEKYLLKIQNLTTDGLFL